MYIPDSLNDKNIFEDKLKKYNPEFKSIICNNIKVYRKEKGGSFSRIYETTDGKTTSYVDKTADSNKEYYYTVRAYSGSYKSAYDTTGYKIKSASWCSTERVRPFLFKLSAILKGRKR